MRKPETIQVHGRAYNLPVKLMECPCGRAMLRWDGTSAWRCGHRWNAGEPRDPVWKSCKYGVRLANLFDDIDLEMKLTLGIDLRLLPLTAYALGLLVRGVLSLSWITPAEAQYQLHYGSNPGHEEEERQHREFRELRSLMSRRSRKGE